jgi:glycine/D-amino acid oxidase-like deaminating enzyme/nitrite reductase/ring-hydroxylating ferredoxin subunit
VKPAAHEAPAVGLPGRPISPWREGADRPDRPPLERDLEVDVCVVGAGIAGLSVAYELSRGGASVAVLEGRRIGDGVTGNTTAKLTALQGTRYTSMLSTHGVEVARAYADANEWGIERVEAIAGELGIDCDLRRKPCFTYTEDEGRVAELEREAEAARVAGLDAVLTTETDLPFDVAGAVKVEDEAEFQPVAYLVGLAAELDRDAPTVYERSRAVRAGGDGVELENGATVKAERTVLATQIPFADRGLFFARASVARSYATTARLDGPVPQGMDLQAESPTRTLRAVPWDGGELLLVGGESHELGHGDPAEKFRAVERFARERFDVAEFEHRWSAHDFMPDDGLPYVGRLSPLSDRVLVVSGLAKWGLAMSAAAGGILADRVLGRESDWATTFDPWRRPPLSAATTLVRHNADSGFHFFKDRLQRSHSVEDLARGQGRVVGSGLEQLAVHRDDAGRLHALSARCTHLGCIVGWNSGELTWDCPCHGSRYTADGEVISGPATRALEPKELPDDYEEEA